MSYKATIIYYTRVMINYWSTKQLLLLLCSYHSKDWITNKPRGSSNEYSRQSAVIKVM